MKDLDFDELDRAVNSLMSGAKSQPQSSEEQEKTLDITPTLDEDEKPSFDRVEKAAKQPTIVDSPTHEVPTPPPSDGPLTSIATRRGGRFMDVVHPSSDMKKPTPPSPVSRRGVTIEPQTKVRDMSMLPPEPKVPTVEADVADTPEDKALASPFVSATDDKEKEPAKAEPVTHPDAISEWPDPLEMAHFDAEDTGATENEQPAQAPEQPEPVEKSEQVEEEEELPDLGPSTSRDNSPAPLVSPFLPHAKVEKRPLGGASSAIEEPDHAPVVEMVDTEKPASIDELHDQLPALPEDVAPVLPEELRSDLMAIESDATDKEDYREAPKEEKSEVPVNPERPSVEAGPLVSPVPSPSELTASDKKDTTPTGPTSIPRQYHEEKSTGEQESGSIYDTSTYHQPLAHPAKNKSGWMWVLWIVAILLVGAGAGAGLYFLGVV